MFVSCFRWKGSRGGSVALSVFVAVVLACVAVFFAVPGERAEAHDGHHHGSDGSFQVSTVFADLTEPTAVEFAEDGRVYVAEKSGIVKVFDGLDDTEPTVFVDLRQKVHSYFDRGLIGMALHPNFPEDPRIYVSYTLDAPIGGAAPVWNDCENLENQQNNECIVSGNLSVVTANADKSDGLEMVGDERVLINDWCQKFTSHSVGDVKFGADGALYMSGGEGADFNSADSGQFDDGACGDPEDEGGAIRSQDPRTSGDPVGLAGTVIRVSPDTGDALPDNPRFTAPDDNESRIIAYGLRNPFRLAMKPETNELWAGNVGWFRWEEINRIPDSRKVGGQFGEVPNFGWPCYEGAFREPGYEAAGIPVCEELYEEDPPSVAEPHLAWRHCDPVFGIQNCELPNISSSTSGVAFYEGDVYPEEYRGGLFFADGPRGKVWMSPEGADGLPDPDHIETVLDDSKGYVVELENGPGGEMYMVQVYGEGYGPGRIAKITQGPVARIEASETSGESPLTVDFDASGSSDPAGRSLSYGWDLDGDGDFDDSTEAAPSFTYSGSENHTVRVRVTNTAGQENVASVTVYPGNTPPTANVNFVGVFIRDASGEIVDTKSANGWRVGDEIGFNGFALDTEDGKVQTPYGQTLPTDAIRWDASIFHCYSADDCHRHPINGFGVGSGGGGIITAPDHGYPSHIELTITATDSRGLSSQRTVRLDPRAVNLTFDSNPAGVPITVGTKRETGPFTRTAIVGSTNTVSAPETADIGGVPHTFAGWSDGGKRSHDIPAPETDTTYTANYEPPTPPETSIDSGPPNSTNSRSATFAFSSSEDGSMFECSLDGAAFAACDSPQEYGQLGDGDHTFEVRAVDAAGNKDASPAKLSWSVDASPPETNIVSGPSASTSSRSATFEFSSSKPNSTYECSLNGAAFAPCSSPKAYSNLAERKHTFEVRARDSLGNVDATPEKREWTVDRTAPNTAISAGPSGTVVSSSATFSFTSTESGSTFECRLDGGSFRSCQSPHVIQGLSRGKHTFAVRARDAAGNVDASPATRIWTTKASRVSIAAMSPRQGAAVKSKSPTVKASVREPEAEVPRDGIKVLVNGKPRPFAYNAKNGVLIAKNKKLRPGRQIVRVVAADSEGNETSHSWRFRIRR